jgi:hypothetical protein
MHIQHTQPRVIESCKLQSLGICVASISHKRRPRAGNGDMKCVRNVVVHDSASASNIRHGT